MKSTMLMHGLFVTVLILAMSEIISGFLYRGLDRIGKQRSPNIVERDFGDQEWYSCYIPSLNPCLPAGSGRQTGRCPNDGVFRDDITEHNDDHTEFSGDVKKYGYFYPAINPSRFIQCDDFGCCFYKKCMTGQVWSNKSKTCVRQQ